LPHSEDWLEEWDSDQWGGEREGGSGGKAVVAGRGNSETGRGEGSKYVDRRYSWKGKCAPLAVECVAGAFSAGSGDFKQRRRCNWFSKMEFLTFLKINRGEENGVEQLLSLTNGRHPPQT